MLLKALYAFVLAAFMTAANAETKLEGMSIYLLGSFILDKQGDVQSLRMASSKNPEIDADLARNISGWKYHPVMLDGLAAEVEVVIDVRLDAAFRPDGQVRQVRIASVRHELKDRSGIEKPNPLSNINVRYPAQYVKNMEAGVVVMMQIGDDGVVQQVGVESVRLYPVGRRGLGDAQKAAAARAFSAAAMNGMRNLKVDLPLLCEYHKLCGGSFPPLGKMVFFNLPYSDGKRYRSWRGYHDVVLQPLPWNDNEIRPPGNQQISLIDPAQAEVLLRHIP
jgi:hypothetical protein